MSPSVCSADSAAQNPVPSTSLRLKSPNRLAFGIDCRAFVSSPCVHLQGRGLARLFVERRTGIEQSSEQEAGARCVGELVLFCQGTTRSLARRSAIAGPAACSRSHEVASQREELGFVKRLREDVCDVLVCGDVRHAKHAILDVITDAEPSRVEVA